jgi:hypothetical protein
VNKSLVSLLKRVREDKEQREYVHWLASLSQFVQP